jgi:plasmid stabilization system protein ParE
MTANLTPLDGKVQFDDMAKWAAKKMESSDNGGLAFLSRRNARAIAAYVAGLEAVIRPLIDFPDDPARKRTAMTGLRLTFGQLRAIRSAIKDASQ